jgi:hypothetical protein
MRFARCVCGFKILVVPDLKAMDRAIKNHVTEHYNENRNLGKLAPGKLTTLLTEQVLIAASK